MRCRSRHSRIVLGNRPFADGIGASLYIGTAGEESINYRRNRISQHNSPFWPLSTSIIDPGAETVPKCQAVAQVTSPTAQLTFDLPPEMFDSTVWYQVRTFKDDRENDSIYRPRSLTTDENGDTVNVIVGTATLVSIQPRDNGGVRVRFNWTASRNGVQPKSFSLVKTAGGGTVPTVTATAYVGKREYTIDVDGLADGVTYTFSLTATRGATTITLLTGLTCLVDASGPGEVTGLVAEAY